MKIIKKALRPAVKRRKRKVPKDPRKRTRVVYSDKGITPHDYSAIVVSKSRQPASYYGFDFGRDICIYCQATRKTIHKGAIEVIEHCPKARTAIMDSVLD